MKHPDTSLVVGADGLLGSTLMSRLKSLDESIIGIPE